MASPPLSLPFLSFSILVFLLHLRPPQARAQAPGPSSSSGPINVTGIFINGGQYNSFLRLLNKTQVLNQVVTQLNSSNQGMTIFAPTDNAFLNLPPGTLNGLSDQQQEQLVLYHILPKYYALVDLLAVSNPVQTLASGQNGHPFGLNFTGEANQVNVSTGIVETLVNSPLRQQFPLAVYEVDKVLLPNFSQGTAPTASPAAGNTTSGGGGGSSSTRPATAQPPAPGNSAGRAGYGLVGGVWLVWMSLVM